MSSYLLCWTVTIFGSMALDRLMVPALRLIAAAAWSASPTCSPARLTWSRVWSDLIVVAASMYPGFDLVGYELGADLQAALIAGFAGIGPLRVWMR